jgi:hypothetical protein
MLLKKSNPENRINSIYFSHSLELREEEALLAASSF